MRWLVSVSTLPSRMRRNQQRHCAGAPSVEDGWGPWVIGVVGVVHWGIRPGVRQVFKTVLKEEGMAGFYKGCAITCARYDMASALSSVCSYPILPLRASSCGLVPNSLFSMLLCSFPPVLPPSVPPPSCAPSRLDACLRRMSGAWCTSAALCIFGSRHAVAHVSVSALAYAGLFRRMHSSSTSMKSLASSSLGSDTTAGGAVAVSGGAMV